MSQTRDVLNAVADKLGGPSGRRTFVIRLGQIGAAVGLGAVGLLHVVPAEAVCNATQCGACGSEPYYCNCCVTCGYCQEVSGCTNCCSGAGECLNCSLGAYWFCCTGGYYYKCDDCTCSCSQWPGCPCLCQAGPLGYC